MKSGNFIELAFVAKGKLQVEYINVEHVSCTWRVNRLSVCWGRPTRAS